MEVSESTLEAANLIVLLAHLAGTGLVATGPLRSLFVGIYLLRRKKVLKLAVMSRGDAFRGMWAICALALVNGINALTPRHSVLLFVSSALLALSIEVALLADKRARALVEKYPKMKMFL